MQLWTCCWQTTHVLMSSLFETHVNYIFGSQEHRCLFLQEILSILIHSCISYNERHYMKSLMPFCINNCLFQFSSRKYIFDQRLLQLKKLKNELLVLCTGCRRLRLEVSSWQRRSFRGVCFPPNDAFQGNQSQVIDRQENQMPVSC